MTEGKCVDCKKYSVRTLGCTHYHSHIDLDLAERADPCSGFEPKAKK